MTQNIKVDADQVMDWREKRNRRQLMVSPTQIETYELCRRKWWFGKVRRLPVPSSTSQVFGTVLHSVCERYLKADDQGRDRVTGLPVDLYPPGWHIAVGRDGEESGDGEITLEEQGQVKTLIDSAIQSGVLERVPDRVIEHNFMRVMTKLVCPTCGGAGRLDDPPIEKCPTCKGDGKGTTIMMTGLIDLAYPEGIQDHKTAKTIRYLCNDKKDSDKYLGNNLQILIYAHELIELLRETDLPVPPKITLRHNQYVKDQKQTRVIKTVVEVTPEHIEETWQRVMKTAIEMSQLRQAVDGWQQIPEPQNLNKACMAYGGCPFRGICGGQETPEQYETRLDKQTQSPTMSVHVPLTIAGRFQLQEQLSQGADPMPVDFNSKLANRTAIGNAANSAAPQVGPQPVAQQPIQQPVQQPVQQHITPPQAQPAQQQAAPQPKGAAKVFTPAEIAQMQTDAGTVPPPWATNNCTACAGLGFNTVGSPCRICDNDRVQAGQAPSTMFTITPVQDGIVHFQYQHDPSVQGHSLSKAPLPSAPKQQERVEAPPIQPQVQQQPTMAPIQPPVPGAAAAQAQAQPLNTTIVPAAQAGVTAEEEDEGKQGKGRPTKGFMLMVNCGVIRGAMKKNTGRYVHNLNTILAQIGMDMASQNNTESFYKLDAFARRDALAAYAPKLVDTFGADIVVANGVTAGSDIKALVDALRPLAGCEVSPIE